MTDKQALGVVYHLAQLASLILALLWFGVQGLIIVFLLCWQINIVRTR